MSAGSERYTRVSAMDGEQGTLKELAAAAAAPSQADQGLNRPNGKHHIMLHPSGRRDFIASITGSRVMLHASLALNIALVSVMFALLSPAAKHPAKFQTEPLKINGSDHCNILDNSVLCLPPAATPRLSSSAIEHAQLCSGNGHYVIADDRLQQQQQPMSEQSGACHCHGCFSGLQCAHLDPDCVLNLFHGDPTMFESYWLAQPQAPTVIPAWQGVSYFAHRHNAFLFVDHYLEQEIRMVHARVGNAVTQGRHIVLGVGSTQLYQAALYALASHDSPTPTSVVSAIPYYSSYEGVTRFLDSRRFKWAGDAYAFQQAGASEPYIELVTSPNNPCGHIREAVVNGTGPVVHDLAYYWPHYTPITAPADYPVMLWTLSKITGHAGTRLGWAVVEDETVAAKMALFIQLNTLGVSQDAQARATTLIRAVLSSCSAPPRSKLHPLRYGPGGVEAAAGQPFFHYGQAVMEDRWRRTRHALHNSSHFILPHYEPSFCSFLGKPFKPNPAFLWLRCKEEEDCHGLLKKHGIIARAGPSFGMPPQYVRVSMLDRPPLFDLLIARLASIP